MVTWTRSVVEPKVWLHKWSTLTANARNVERVCELEEQFQSFNSNNKQNLLYFGSPTAYPYLRPMTRYLCAGVGVVVRILINILAGRECACVCV